MLDTMVEKESIKDNANHKENADEKSVSSEEFCEQLDHFEQDDVGELAEICIDIDTSIIIIEKGFTLNVAPYETPGI